MLLLLRVFFCRVFAVFGIVADFFAADCVGWCVGRVLIGGDGESSEGGRKKRENYTESSQTC